MYVVVFMLKLMHYYIITVVICSLTNIKKSGIFYTTKLKKEKKVNIFVVRVTKSGITGNARPCQNCLQMMKDLNVNKVYYSTGIDDEIICESVKNMISIQTSSVTKYLLALSNVIIKNSNYFENLLIKKFPPKIKEENLMYFLEYNFKNVLSECSYIIKNENYNKIIIFYNKNKEQLLSSIII
jgi:hypothetical protein